MTKYIIGLGSSHTCQQKYIDQACLLLDQTSGIKILAKSKKHSGLGEKCPQSLLLFSNSCILVSTRYSPCSLWHMLSSIENKLGRIRIFDNNSRTIDLDILHSPNLTYQNNNLEIPHPEFRKRTFALEPAKEIAQKFNFFLKNI